MLRELLTQVPPQGWLGVSGALVFVVAHTLITRRNAHALVRRWAAERGLTILKARQRTFVPFFGPAKGQFFRVRVADADGRIKRCWLRFHDGTSEPGEILVDWDA